MREKRNYGSKNQIGQTWREKKTLLQNRLADSESPRDGKFLENVGTYDPLYDPAKIILKTERIQYWMDQGALPTDTVHSLLKKEGFFAANA